MKIKKPNKRMCEYWLDESETGEIIPIKMPYKYVIEQFCDMVGASKAYNKDNWNPKMLWDYWNEKCRGKRIQHKHTEYFIEKLIWNYYQMGEEVFFRWYNKNKKFLEKLYNKNEIELKDEEMRHWKV